MSDSDMLDRITHALDRSFQYLIVDSNRQKRMIDFHRKIMDALGASGIQILEENAYTDPKRNREYLVLKLNRDSMQNFNLEALYALMPKDVFWYFYENTF